jgi:acyl-CoA oxidase
MAVTAAPPATHLLAALDGPWHEVRQRVRDHLTRPELAPAIAVDREAHRARVARQLELLAQLESPARAMPAAHGGADDTGGAAAAFEALAVGDLSLLVKVGVQFGLFGGAILHLGTEAHHRRYLPQVVDATLPGCFAMTETGHGSDVAALATTATYDAGSDELVIDTPESAARKDYIGGAARDARLAVVFAQLVAHGERHGVHAVLVPLRDADGRTQPGVTISDCGPKAGLDGVDNGRLTFDGVRVPRSALLDRFGGITDDGSYHSPIENDTKRFFRMLGTLVQGRVSVAGAALSATKTALTIAVRYGLERRQFSPPDSSEEVRLLDYRAHQRRLLPAVATTYALSFAQNALVSELDRVFSDPETDDRIRRELEARAAGLKAVATWHATETIQTCREACGGAGYLAANRLPQLGADTDVFTTFEGDNTVLLQLVAKGLLTDYREQFDDLDLAGLARFVAEQVVGTVAERVAVRPLVQSLIDAVAGREDDADLRERGWHCRMLCWREQHLLEGLAGRLKRGIDAGEDQFAVFNDCQDHVLLAATAHVDRLVLEALIEAVAGCEDEPTAALLSAVGDLHALTTIERERAWFMEHNRLSAVRAKAVTDTVNRLCDELRPHTEALVDGFDVPDQAVAAPIALGDATSPPPAAPAG